MSTVTIESVVYQIDGKPYESRLVFDADIQSPRPGLVMAPNWMGVSEGAERIAQAVAAKGYPPRTATTIAAINSFLGCIGVNEAPP